MIRYLSCGQYLCRISGSNNLINLIPDSWKENQQVSVASSDTIMIDLEEEKLEYEVPPNDGWFVRDKQNFPIYVYHHNGKVLFGLQNLKPYFVTVRVTKEIDSYVRIGIQYGLMLALHQKCVGIHGVTILCGNEIILLSAASGTGKTTLAKLLEKYCDAIVINGDFALLSFTDEGVIFEPTPFCGTSRRALNHRFRLNRIVFLGQAKENRWCELDGREAMIRCMSNSFVPEWDSRIQRVILENILKCIDAVKIDAYDFAPTQEAAVVFLKRVEEDSSLRQK